MNYQESSQIWDKIRSANKIVLNIHRTPDPDTVGSALALYHVLLSLNKNASIVCPDEIEESLHFLPNSEVIQKIDYQAFDFSEFNLFIIGDSSSPDVVTGSVEIALPDIEKVVIDHHASNKKFGQINLVDAKAAANCQVLYKVFQDWKVEISEKTATCLLTGIMGDTGVFQYPHTGSETMKIGGELMELGASRDEIIFNLYRKHSIQRIRLIGEMLQALQLDEVHKFAWSAINNKIYSKYNDKNAKGVASAMFMQNIEGTNFGVVIVEGDDHEVWVSLRSRIASFDVLKIAKELGGGGHKVAAGATIKGMAFEEALEKVLSICRKYANTD